MIVSSPAQGRASPSSSRADQSTSPSVPPRGGNPQDSEHFLELLLAQITQQDPLEPLDNAQMMNQIVGLQTLEQLSRLRAELARPDPRAALDLVGRLVELKDSSGQTVRGPVTAVRIRGEEVELVLDGRSFPFSALESVFDSPRK